LSSTVHIPSEAGPPNPVVIRILHGIENAALALTLAAMMIVGVSDLEFWGKLGIPIRVPGAEMLVRHLTLIAGMLGGMVAAREKRLLAISSLTQYLPEFLKDDVARFSGVIATVVSAMLSVAAFEFVRSMKDFSGEFAIGLPVWWAQAFLPLGFAVIALRVWWHSTESWRWRLILMGITSALIAMVLVPPVAPGIFLWPFVVTLVLATLLGAPIFVALGGAAIVLFWTRGEPVAPVSLDHYDQVTNPLLATLPLFTLAGYLLAESRASHRLVRFFNGWVGWIRGGPAIVTAMACAFFTTFTGGSGVTILALGGLLMPVLLAARYEPKTALGLMTGAGSLGILFPPCLPLILYSIIAGVSMSEMFLGGLLPGALMVGLTAAFGVWKAPPGGPQRPRFDLMEALEATWAAKWELLVPVIPLVLIFGGIALPVPAAAATAAFAFITQVFIHRELRWGSSLPKVFVECGLLIGGVLLILGTAMGFTNFLITEHVPDNAAQWIGQTIHNKIVFLLVLNLFLLAVGCMMDIFAATVVIVPLLIPMAAHFGIHPVHLGIIFLANLELGYLTPPVGLNLFLASYRFDKPVIEVARATLPMLGVLAIGVLLITYLPPITLWLPSLLTQ